MSIPDQTPEGTILPSTEPTAVIGRVLQAMYGDLVAEPLPDQMLLLLAQIDGAYSSGGSAPGAGASPDAQDRLRWVGSRAVSRPP